MVSLLNQRDFRPIQRLQFCYLCGEEFKQGDSINRDHVPPDAAFVVEQKEPLLLPTHKACNSRHGPHDEKMSQFLGLLRGHLPSDPAHWRLEFAAVEGGFEALQNVDIHGAVWRWIRGFHAALYRQPLTVGLTGELNTPFPSAQIKPEGLVLDVPTGNYPPLANVLNKNRAASNVDRIVSNKGAVTYECVWGRPDQQGPWLCAFSLDVSDWKLLGEPRLYQRDCLGFYVQDTIPPSAIIEVGSPAGNGGTAGGPTASS